METAAARVRRPILETPSVVLIGHTARGWLPDTEGRTAPPELVTGPGDLPDRLISELRRVGDRHGALVTELPPDSSYVSGWPDGPFATILVPIHPFRLCDAIDWFYERLEPGSVNATVAARLVADEVTYAKGEAPRVPRDVDVAPQQALQEGALPVYTTIWTGVPWSDLQMERRLFMLEIQTAFRYVDGLLESLREAGLLARREAPPEWRPVLVPSLIVGDSHRLVPVTEGPPCGIQRMLGPGNWNRRIAGASCSGPWTRG